MTGASSLPRAALAGWINTRAVRITVCAPALEDAGTRQCIDTGNFRVAFDPASVDHVISAEAITLCSGAPRSVAGDRVTAQSIATHLLTRGNAALADLRGHFSIVHVDVHARAITLATDRFGVRPLAYAVRDGEVWFADRADAVAAESGAGISPQAIFDYVYFHVIAAPRTIFAGVSRLEPSRSLRVDGRGSEETLLWAPHFVERTDRSLPELERQFRTVLERSVARELDSARIGAFLSGGTDSSTVAGMIGRASGKPAETFSIGFAQAGYDEMAYARIAARHFGADHHEHYVTPDDLLAHIPVVAASYDQPFGNSSAVPAYSCVLLAREHGVARMLAGDGGDELFGGNTRYAKQKVFDVYARLPESWRQAVLEPTLAGGSAAKRVPLLRKLSSYVEQARVPMPDRTETYNLLQRFGAPNVFSAALLSGVDAGAPLALQRQVWAGVGDAAFVNRMLAYDWRFTLSDTDLVKVTGITALAGIDVRFPLLNDDLVDFSVALPASMKVRGLTLRWFFKRALRDFLPMEILRKKKHGFGLPFGPWLARHDDLRRFARAALDRLVARNVIRAALVDDLFSARLAEHAGYYGEMIWILMMLEHWLAAHAPDFAVAAGGAVASRDNSSHH